MRATQVNELSVLKILREKKDNLIAAIRSNPKKFINNNLTLDEYIATIQECFDTLKAHHDEIMSCESFKEFEQLVPEMETFINQFEDEAKEYAA